MHCQYIQRRLADTISRILSIDPAVRNLSHTPNPRTDIGNNRPRREEWRQGLEKQSQANNVCREMGIHATNSQG